MSKKMESGHRMIWIKGRGYVYEHRYKMEKKLGRRLRSDEIVHHKDGNPASNSGGNLEVTTKAGHNKIDPTHHKGGRTKGS